jgi:integrase/recombinase XerD
MEKRKKLEKMLHQRFTKSEIVTPRVKYHKAAYLRSDRPTKSEKYPVMLRVTINRKFFREQIPIELAEHEFNDVDFSVRIAGDKDRSHMITRIIQNQLAKAENIFNRYMIMDKALTIETFRMEWKRHNNTKSFYSWVQDEIKNLNTSRSTGTITVYKTVMDRFESFSPGLTFAELDTQLIEKYDRYLLSLPSLSANTRSKHHKTVKTFCNIARNNNLIFEDPYKNYKVKRVKSNRQHISKDTLDKLTDLYHKKELRQIVQQALHSFLFSCYTGIRYSDCCVLNHQNLVGRTLVFTPVKTIKNGIKVKLELSNEAYALINKGNGPLIDMLNENNTNSFLREIRTAYKIAEPITFHVARHTFGTHFILAGGGVEMLQQLMGHAKIETTMIYVHMANEAKAQRAQMKKFSKHINSRSKRK